jgi:hypothetical protein
VSGEDDQEIVRKLEEDAKRVLQFMAANGLVTNVAIKSFYVAVGQKHSNRRNHCGGQRVGKICHNRTTWNEH